jgi:hypothetical protein
MPYGYYQFVRLAAAIFFVVSAMNEFQVNRNSVGLVFIGLAILFQPLVKIALGLKMKWQGQQNTCIPLLC